MGQFQNVFHREAATYREQVTRSRPLQQREIRFLKESRLVAFEEN